MTRLGSCGERGIAKCGNHVMTTCLQQHHLVSSILSLFIPHPPIPRTGFVPFNQHSRLRVAVLPNRFRILRALRVVWGTNCALAALQLATEFLHHIHRKCVSFWVCLCYLTSVYTAGSSTSSMAPSSSSKFRVGGAHSSGEYLNCYFLLIDPDMITLKNSMLAMLPSSATPLLSSSRLRTPPSCHSHSYMVTNCYRCTLMGALAASTFTSGCSSSPTIIPGLLPSPADLCVSGSTSTWAFGIPQPTQTSGKFPTPRSPLGSSTVPR